MALFCIAYEPKPFDRQSIEDSDLVVRFSEPSFDI